MFVKLDTLLSEEDYRVTDEEVIKAFTEIECVPFEIPSVPSSVEDWIRLCKNLTSYKVSLSSALNPLVWEANHLSEECQEWLYNAENQEIFALLWIGRDCKKK